ncbi:MAG: sporulation protein YqfD [Clostridia bacterium]|nr:sporulation protein YqfD [Clostridia bacterium]
MKSDFLVHVEGLLLEKLIRRALENGACFGRIVRKGDRAMDVEATEKDAQILLSLCKRYSVSAKILKVKGRPVRRVFLRSRLSLPVCIVVFISLCWFFLSRIWFVDIEFTGPQARLGNTSVLMKALEDMQIHPGMRNSVDEALLSGNLEALLTGYSYVSAKVQGTRLLVEAAPEVPEPTVYDIGYARDLYSCCDGVVESVLVHSGIACVQPGDVIKRGQLLIRGEEKLTNEETRSIGAKGEAIVRTWYEGSSSGCLIETRDVYTGRQSSSSELRLMEFSIPLTEGEAFALSDETVSHLPIGGVFLPLEIVRRDMHEMHRVTQRADMETLSDHLQVLSMADAAIQLTLKGPDVFDIARSWIRYDDSYEGMLSACAVYEIYTDAAEEYGALIQGG